MTRFRVLLIGGALSLAGCSRPALLVSQSIEVTASARTVHFARAVPASGPTWELCFEFHPPGDSLKAKSIEAVLLAASGQRRPLVDVAMDRRGESVVCQIGRVDASDPDEALVFEAMELTASERVRVRQVRGGPRSGRSGGRS